VRPAPPSSTLSLHDALPISAVQQDFSRQAGSRPRRARRAQRELSSSAATTSPVASPIQMPSPSSGVKKPSQIAVPSPGIQYANRSEEHTSELQSRENLVCRL